MYAALFEMTSWLGPQQYIVRGSDAAGLLRSFEKIRHLGCLLRMGRSEEGREGQRMLDKLERILNKRNSGTLTNKDLLTLDIELSVGTIKCAEIVEGDDAAAQLKAKYPEAIA